MRRLLESLYAFTVPADPQNREWARRAAPLEIHERVLRFLTGRHQDVLDRLAISSIPPLDAMVEALFRSSVAEPFARTLRRVATHTIHFVHARDRARDPGSRETTLLLLERLTITVHLRIDGERSFARFKSRGFHLADLDNDPFRAFGVRWVEWCVSPPRRELRLIEEYDQTSRSLQSLMREARATTPSARWKALQALTGGGTLRLGPLTYRIPAQFWRAANPDWAISELAEGLLALRHTRPRRGLNRTAIKEQLRRQRLERDIGHAWTQYGRWLHGTPAMQHQVESLLGGFPLSPDTPSISTTNSNPLT
jgi:hypothetical protein